METNLEYLNNNLDYISHVYKDEKALKSVINSKYCQRVEKLIMDNVCEFFDKNIKKLKFRNVQRIFDFYDNYNSVFDFKNDLTINDIILDLSEKICFIYIDLEIEKRGLKKLNDSYIARTLLDILNNRI